MPNSFQELEGCCVSSTFTRATLQIVVFHSYMFSHRRHSHMFTIKQEAATLTTHLRRSWLWDRQVCYKKDDMQPDTVTKNMGLCSGLPLWIDSQYCLTNLIQSHLCWWQQLHKATLKQVWTEKSAHFEFPSHCPNNTNKSKGFHSYMATDTAVYQ